MRNELFRSLRSDVVAYGMRRRFNLFPSFRIVLRIWRNSRARALCRVIYIFYFFFYFYF